VPRQRLLAVIAASLAGPLALPAAASACTCAAEVPESRRFAAADAALVGVLESRRPIDPPRADGLVSTGDRFVHRYRVQRRYKGRLGAKVWVRTVRSSATCGLPQRRRVALYLDRIDGTWHAGLCSTTSEAAIRAVVRRRDRDRSARAAAALRPACRRAA
jgi:hypothetical protein